MLVPFSTVPRQVNEADSAGTSSIEPSDQFAYAAEDRAASPIVFDWRDRFETQNSQHLSHDADIIVPIHKPPDRIVIFLIADQERDALLASAAGAAANTKTRASATHSKAPHIPYTFPSNLRRVCDCSLP
jgi:hypothetical protein